MNNAQRFEAVIFDLFGTLVDDFPGGDRMHVETALALSALSDQFTRLWRETGAMRTTGAFKTVAANIEHVCGVLGVPVEPEQIRKAVEIRLQYTRRALKPRPDAIATLAQLKDRNYKIGLISNCSPDVPVLWQETDFSKLIDVPVFSCAAGVKKPDARIYRLACERLGVAPERCLYVADGENRELAGAAEVGLHPVLIRISSQAPDSGVHQEAKDWQGTTIGTLTEVLGLASK